MEVYKTLQSAKKKVILTEEKEDNSAHNMLLETSRYRVLVHEIFKFIKLSRVGLEKFELFQ